MTGASNGGTNTIRGPMTGASIGGTNTIVGPMTGASIGALCASSELVDEKLLELDDEELLECGILLLLGLREKSGGWAKAGGCA